MACENDLYQSIYRRSPVGLVIVDQEAQLVDINEYMIDLFQLPDTPYKGQRFGTVFRCAELPQGWVCGSTQACSRCRLRKLIRRVLEDGRFIHDIILTHTFRLHGKPCDKWFKVSANAAESYGRKLAVISFVDITKEKQYEALLQRKLTLDLATGVLNKQSLLDTLKNLPSYCSGEGSMSIGIIDFDDFKVINDQFGHLVGDQVLREFTHLARKTLRQKDIIGRYGGEEFMLVLPDTSVAQAALALQRIHCKLRSRFHHAMGVAFSAGFVEVSSQELMDLDADEIIHRADGYLYQAKKAGKRRIVSGDYSLTF